ncbi:G2/M phase-specific E3 ubiquitin-protein ligase-like isoform X2 [Archocentrus centrarchus]|uniref:G2/M phase-specific E3 ubiquitin-protein ligase-like isoform X2 n=1 Tax=Archocentrus centrarchus TaxID=63155 RepID=UPI0011EA2D4A|nr:G2/M phase-specific E3 ubiquitin-protein ligase-like isoform X2 [Archocentrus centrarchus]
MQGKSVFQQFFKYREGKEAERRMFSKCKKKSKKIVKISVGIMNKTKTGMRPIRGKTLPLDVEPSWSSEKLLGAAIKKLKDMEAGEYILLYPDGSQVKNIPGTDTPFTIQLYKEAVGKSYQRITLFVCTTEGFLSENPRDESDSEDEEDDEVIVRVPPIMSPLSDTVLWTSPESSTPESRHRSPSTSQPSSVQVQNATGPQKASTSADHISSHFYNTYTNIYAPVIIDSSSSEAEVEDFPMEDSDEPDGLTAADVISNLSLKINKTSCSRFNINRANVWDGAYRGFRRSTYSPNSAMMVKFSDDVGLVEEALDTGGPTREFLTLLMEAVKTRRIFEGKDHAKYLTFDSKAAEENEYFYVGRMIAVSIVHGGPGPRCLSPNFFMYLVGKDKTFEAPIDDIPDEEIKKALLEIKNAKSVNELRVLSEKHSSLLQTAGCYRFMGTLEDKKKVVADYIQWYFIYRNHLSIQRFREGLATLDFVNALEQHPSLFSLFMCYTETRLTADAVEDIFHMQFSPPDSTRCQEETRVLSYWQDYLLYVEEKSGNLSLEDILMFATGLREIPPAGIQPKPQLLFEATSHFPVANVCANTIRIPVLHSYEEFQEAMDYGIQNSPGFGLP